MTTPAPFAPRRPAFAGPRAFLAAMGALGASAIVTHEDEAVRVDFAVPTERAARAAVLVGDPTTWPDGRWDEVTALAVVLAGGVALLDGANDETRTVDLSSLARPAPRRSGVVLPFGRPSTVAAAKRRRASAGSRGGRKHGR